MLLLFFFFFFFTDTDCFVCCYCESRGCVVMREKFMRDKMWENTFPLWFSFLLLSQIALFFINIFIMLRKSCIVKLRIVHWIWKDVFMSFYLYIVNRRDRLTEQNKGEVYWWCVFHTKLDAVETSHFFRSMYIVFLPHSSAVMNG